MAETVTILGEPYIPQRSLAREFEVSRETLRRWELQGTGLRSIKLGRNRFYPEKGTKEFLKSKMGA